MNRLVKSGRTDLSLTLVELCSLSAFVCAGMNVPRTCVCMWAPILNNTFPHVTNIFFEAVAVMSLF